MHGIGDRRVRHRDRSSRRVDGVGLDRSDAAPGDDESEARGAERRAGGAADADSGRRISDRRVDQDAVPRQLDAAPVSRNGAGATRKQCRRAGPHPRGVVGQAGDDLLTARTGVIGFDAAEIQRPVGDLHDVPGVDGQGPGQIEVRVKEIAEWLDGSGLSGRDPGEVIAHRPVERQGVQSVTGTPITAHVGERTGESVEVDGREPRPAVGDGVVRQAQVVGADQVDAECARVINRVALELNRLPCQAPGQDPLLAGCRNGGSSDGEGARRHAAEVDQDAVSAKIRERAAIDGERRLGGDPVPRRVPDIAVVKGQCDGRARGRPHRDAGGRVANLATGERVGEDRVEDQATPITRARLGADTRYLLVEDRAAGRNVDRGIAQARQDRAVGGELTALDDDRPERGYIVGWRQDEVAIDGQAAVDQVAQWPGRTAVADRLPGERGCGRAVKGDGVQAIPGAGVASDGTVEVGVADIVQIDRRVARAGGPAVRHGIVPQR